MRAKGDGMPAHRANGLNERLSNDRDMFTFRLVSDADGERMKNFSRGRISTLMTYISHDIPDNLFEAAEQVHLSASQAGYFEDSIIDSEEFALGIVITTYILKRLKEEET